MPYQNRPLIDYHFFSFRMLQQGTQQTKSVCKAMVCQTISFTQAQSLNYGGVSCLSHEEFIVEGKSHVSRSQKIVMKWDTKHLGCRRSQGGRGAPPLPGGVVRKRNQRDNFHIESARQQFLNWQTPTRSEINRRN